MNYAFAGIYLFILLLILIGEIQLHKKRNKTVYSVGYDKKSKFGFLVGMLFNFSLVIVVAKEYFIKKEYILDLVFINRITIQQADERLLALKVDIMMVVFPLVFTFILLFIFLLRKRVVFYQDGFYFVRFYKYTNIAYYKVDLQNGFIDITYRIMGRIPSGVIIKMSNDQIMYVKSIFNQNSIVSHE